MGLNKIIKHHVTFLIPTYNCGYSIRDTIESVKWADEIIVVDSYSVDETLDIVKKYDAKVVQHEYANSAKQKNWALDYCTFDWVFQIDSDETLEPGAEKIIRDTINVADEDIHCFRMPRRNHVLGEWVKYGGLYPDWEYRLFRKEYGRWGDREVHSRIFVSGEIKLLGTPLIHHGMPNITKQLKNLDRYTRYESDDFTKRGTRFSWLKWFFGPPFIFFKNYFMLQGFRDGWRGFFLAAYAGIYYFLSHSKLLEMETLKLEKSPK